jgi:hypothetical protein
VARSVVGSRRADHLHKLAIMTQFLTSPINRIERRILRPVWLATITAVVVALLGRHWWSAGAAVLGLLLLGHIGAGLHPLASARDLCNGPTSGMTAEREAALLPVGAQLALAARASTQIAVFFVLALSWLAIAGLRWRWFVAIPAAWVGGLLVGVLIRWRLVVVPAGVAVLD